MEIRWEILLFLYVSLKKFVRVVSVESDGSDHRMLAKEAGKIVGAFVFDSGVERRSVPLGTVQNVP